jgi:CBS-domain-containing membrane protein
LRHHIRTFTARHEHAGDLHAHLKSGAGAVVGIGAVGGLATLTGLPLLMAPLGASAVLLFGQPASPLAQPANIFGGYLLATIVGVGAALVFPGMWWAAALAVGAAIAGMLILRVTHPPAGAVPLVALAAPLQSSSLFTTILIGCVSLVGLAIVHHRLPPRIQYPRPLPLPSSSGARSTLEQRQRVLQR